jgi:hypothetical protein
MGSALFLEATLRARVLALLTWVALSLSARALAARQVSSIDSVSAAANAAGRSAATVGWIATLVPVGAGTLLMASGSDSDAFGWGYVIASGGVILGPSVANWSAGQTGRGFAGMFIRMGIAWGGLVVAASNCFLDCSENELAASNGIFIGTQVVALGLAIWEVATIKNRVIRERGGTISVGPTYSPATRSIGFAAHVRF